MPKLKKVRWSDECKQELREEKTLKFDAGISGVSFDKIEKKEEIKEEFGGEVTIAAVAEGEEEGVGVWLSFDFQVAGVRKPLISVKRITEKINLVKFGPKLEDNYILKVESGLKIPLTPNGKGSYLMKVRFENGVETEITVDSGAEESVCPWSWGEQFGLDQSGRVLNLVSANGSKIAHYGARKIFVVSPF